MELEKEKAKRLLDAIFSEDETADNYPETTLEKVGYAEYVALKAVEKLVPAIERLGRLHRLLLIAEKSGELPDIITHNELRAALKNLLWAENDVAGITDMVRDLYEATKPKGAQ